MIPKSGVILFSASWAAESSQSARQILEAACPLNNLEFVEIEEAEGTESVFDAMRVEAVPCVVRMWEGKEVGRVTGADSKAILSLLKSAPASGSASVSMSAPVTVTATATGTPSTPAIPTTPTPVTPEQLKELVERSKLMLFIKVTPSKPQCGFTSQLLRLLSENGLNYGDHYDTFNILADPGVREGLKVWAQWPTYPQIYWKGELVGGLDILKEMFASGQMSEIVAELRGE